MCGNIFCAPANIWFEKSFAISKLGTKHLIEKVKLLFLVAWKLKLSAALACVPNKKFPLQTGILYEVVKFTVLDTPNAHLFFVKFIATELEHYE